MMGLILPEEKNYEGLFFSSNTLDF